MKGYCSYSPDNRNNLTTKKEMNMSHHSDERMPEDLRKALGLGATGQHPQGKIAPDDEGELQLAVGVTNGKVVVDFGTSVKWIGLDPDQALQLANSIRMKALEIKIEDGL